MMNKTLACECGWTFVVDSTNFGQLEDVVAKHLISCHVVFEDDFVRDTTRIRVKEKCELTVCPVCGQERKMFDMRDWIREDGKEAKICNGCSDTICGVR